MMIITQNIGVPAANLPSYNWVREDEEQELRALKQAHGNKTRAAAMLGMSARQFRYRLVKLGLGDGGALT